ncbi:MAG: GAF domain-containing protein [Anaerolineales bacterium]
MDNYWQALLESLEDELIVIGRDMRVKWANAAMRKQWAKREQGPLINQHCHVINHASHPCGTESCRCPLPDVFTSGQSSRVVHVHSNGIGAERYVEIIASPLRNGDGEIHEVIEVRRDVTQRRLTQQALLRRNRELDALHRVTVAAGSSLELDQVLNTALDAVLQVTELDAGTIYLQRGDDLVLGASHCLSPEAARAARILRMEDTPCGMAVTMGRPLVTHHLTHLPDPRWEPLRQEGLQTLIHIPLLANGYAVGSLCLGSRIERHFDDDTVALLTALGSQIAIAIERSQLHEELARKERMRRALLRQVITAQENERKRIARELHDEIMQSLTAMLYALENAAQESDPAAQAQLTSRMWTLAQRTLDEAHNLIHDLRPTLLDNLGLFSAVRWLADQRLTAAGLEVQLTRNGSPLSEEETLPRLSSDIETALYRVLQEAINNIAEHAQARRVAVNFEFEPDRVSVLVEDDGIGFDLDEVAQSPDMKRGLGLMSMWERMELVGGKVAISPTPGEGTSLDIHVPLPKEKPGE